MPEKPIIKLLRLRASLDIYQNLGLFLDFMKRWGYNSISENDENWKNFEKELKKRSVRGLDLGDVKSTFRQLEIIQDSNLSEFGEKCIITLCISMMNFLSIITREVMQKLFFIL